MIEVLIAADPLSYIRWNKPKKQKFCDQRRLLEIYKVNLNAGLESMDPLLITSHLKRKVPILSYIVIDIFL